MAISVAQSRASMKYIKSHTKQYNFRYSLQYDADVIAVLDAIPNKQGYIKDLIRADIARKAAETKEATMKYQINYTDPDTGATSPIDTVTAQKGYTAEDYIRGCRENADQEWIDMLDRGTVTVEPVE